MTTTYSEIKQRVRVLERQALAGERLAATNGRDVALRLLSYRQAVHAANRDTVGFAAATIAKRRLMRRWKVGGDT